MRLLAIPFLLSILSPVTTVASDWEEARAELAWAKTEIQRVLYAHEHLQELEELEDEVNKSIEMHRRLYRIIPPHSHLEKIDFYSSILARRWGCVAVFERVNLVYIGPHFEETFSLSINRKGDDFRDVLGTAKLLLSALSWGEPISGEDSTTISVTLVWAPPYAPPSPSTLRECKSFSELEGTHRTESQENLLYQLSEACATLRDFREHRLLLRRISDAHSFSRKFVGIARQISGSSMSDEEHDAFMKGVLEWRQQKGEGLDRDGRE
jgi:hypothetical protein